jgi:RNA polymerase sigma factor (sigma-70 family)
MTILKQTPPVPPPPPLRRGSGAFAPVQGERELLQRWERVICAASRRVYYPENLGMSAEDVRQDLRVTLVSAARRYAAERGAGALPPGPFLTTVIKRRVFVLIRDSQVPFRRDEQARPAEDGKTWWHPQSDLQSADAKIEATDREAICSALVYVLRRRLTPAQFALIHLRYIEGLAPQQIAKTLGCSDSQVINKRLTFARQRAAAHLAALGIDTWEALAELTPEEIDHADLD